MSELPPNIDAILASIRSRMAEDAPVAAKAAAPEAAVVPAPELPEPATVSLGGADMTLDGLMRSLLEPMLQRWLDANLPEIVEKIAQAEIRRLTGRG
jgi:cell pole-organizing protein PopZ